MHSLNRLPLVVLLSLAPSAIARRGLSPSSLGLLTRGTDYTFHSICADFHNPDIYFDEMVFSAPSTKPLPFLLDTLLSFLLPSVRQSKTAFPLISRKNLSFFFC